jgi:hypothetical protein
MTSLAGKMFEAPEDLLETVTEFFEAIQRSELEIVFSYWMERVCQVLANNGDSHQNQSSTEPSLGALS